MVAVPSEHSVREEAIAHVEDTLLALKSVIIAKLKSLPLKVKFVKTVSLTVETSE